MYLAKIYIIPKQTVNDPQGLTIENSLHTLGFKSVNGVRVGKYMEIRLDEKTKETAEKAINAMCEKLLSNPVIESYRFDIESL